MKTNYITGLFVFFLTLKVAAQTTTINYTGTTADIANPERGIYHYTETHSSSYSALNTATLQGFRTTENVTLIYRIFYLEDFVAAPISNSYLANIQADFNAARAAGIKCIVRFSYTDQANPWPPAAPYGDATKAWMLYHIAQLEPYLQANSDIIAVAQAGFIGIWGEWYYTTYFGDPNAGPLTATNYADRKEVLDRLLTALPTTRMIQVRTPAYKYKLYNGGSIVPITNAQAFDGTSLSRIGHHNDCFLASSDDYGTYSNTTTEYPYLNAETNYVPMGGETCALNAPRTDCNGDALNEFSEFHWSFINRDYINTVWNGWISQGCSTQIKSTLGYRFQLNTGTYSTTAKPGGGFDINLSLSNTGWASPYNPRLVEVVLKNSSDGKICRARLPVDPRLWLAGANQTLNYSIAIPSNFPNGTYNVYLSLPDPETNLYEKAAYSIRLANSNTTWDAATGYNYLGFDLTIDNSYSAPDYTGSPTFDLCYGSLPVKWVEFKVENINGSNSLEWITETEESNSYFEVERSVDGIQYEKITKINASENNHYYSYLDPYPPKGKVYYRISQYDLNGSFSYSPIRSCTVKSNWLISPNPFSDYAKIELATDDSTSIQIEIFDMTGNCVVKENYTSGNVHVGQELKPGIYLLRVISQGDSYCTSLVKMSE